MKIRVCIFLLTLLPTLTLAAPGDERFLAAREAFRTGDRARLEAQYSAAQAAGVRGEAQTLDPWIEYWRLRQGIDELEDGTISDFLKRQNDSYLAERLRSDWLKAQGKKRQWAAYTSEYGYAALRQPDTELQCYALQARLAAQPESATATLAEARNLWFSILDLPESCMPLIDNLVRQGGLNVDDVWLRLRRLLENRRYQGAQRTADYLPGSAFPAVKSLEQIADKPLRYLDKSASAHNITTRQGRELLLFALQRLSRSDLTSAAARLRALGKKFSDEERAYAWGQLAWQAALRHQPEALDWYALANRDKGSSLSEEQRAWQIRAALRAHDWPRVQKAIDQLPPALATQADWIYWLGRARAEQGQGEEARTLFLKIAGQPSFYGNLADEELGRRITLPPRPQPPSAEELAAVRNQAGLRRALALFRLGMRPEGVREWNWALRGMNDRLLLAAAHLAQSNEIFDRAIYSAERTQALHDYSLRYLTPFRDNVLPQTRQMALDAGWVYGLMRQESRFVMNAQSGVGAKGLMQLMPKTAAWVAKKIGMTNFHPSDVTLMDTNVALGTHYLQMVLSDLDQHPVLASAAYNAGPGRARRWRGDQPLEGAIYAETIPFDETRDYVKKVMSNAVYYAAQFEGAPQSLKARLGMIGGGAATPAASTPATGKIADLP